MGPVKVYEMNTSEFYYATKSMNYRSGGSAVEELTTKLNRITQNHVNVAR